MGFTRKPVIVNGCFYRHCFYGLLCTRSIAVPAGLFCGLMGWLFVDVIKINGLAFYVRPFSLAWSVYLGFTHLVPSLDIPYSVGDTLMGMV